MSNICGLGVSDRSVSGAQPALRVSAAQAVGGGSVFAPSAGTVLDFTSATISDTLAARGFAFARADAVSCATYIDSSGVMQVAPANAMRQTHDPVTLAPLGFLCEEQSANAVRNGNATGAAVGSPGTMPTYWNTVTNGTARTVVGSGVEDGIPYVDLRFTGVTTANVVQVRFEDINAIAATSGNTWTASANCRLVAGSLTNMPGNMTVTTLFRDAGGAILLSLGTVGTLSPDALRTQRTSRTTTAPASTAFVQPAISFDVAVGAAVDFTVRIGGAQCEQKPFATSYIPTSSAAVTRQLDALTLGDLSRIGFNPAASSVIVQGRILGQSALVYPGVVALGMGVEGDKVVLYRDGNSSRFIVEAKTAGVTQYLLSVTAAPATGAEYKTAFAFAANDASQTTSGAAPVKDASVALSTILDRMSIGGFQARGGGTNGAQIIRRVDYYPRRLADAELQSLTA